MINTLEKFICECESINYSVTFSGWSDFDEFLTTIKETSYFSSVPVKVPHSNVGLQENWYKCNKCQAVWRLVEPDPPFTGLWKQVK